MDEYLDSIDTWGLDAGHQVGQDTVDITANAGDLLLLEASAKEEDGTEVWIENSDTFEDIFSYQGSDDRWRYIARVVRVVKSGLLRVRWVGRALKIKLTRMTSKIQEDLKSRVFSTATCAACKRVLSMGIRATLASAGIIVPDVDALQVVGAIWRYCNDHGPGDIEECIPRELEAIFDGLSEWVISALKTLSSGASDALRRLRINPENLPRWAFNPVGWAAGQTCSALGICE